MMKTQKMMMITATLALGLSACGGDKDTTDTGVSCAALNAHDCFLQSGCTPILCTGNEFKACQAGEPDYSVCGAEVNVNYRMWVDAEYNGWGKYEDEKGDPIRLPKNAAEGTTTKVRIHMRRDRIKGPALAWWSTPFDISGTDPKSRLLFTFNGETPEIYVEWDAPNNLKPDADGTVEIAGAYGGWKLRVEFVDDK